MQVRHIEQAQLDLARAEKAELLAPITVQDEKPWEEIVECLALLAAIHMQPCQTALERDDAEKKRQSQDGEPEE
jgi:hypothetical protein